MTPNMIDQALESWPVFSDLPVLPEFKVTLTYVSPKWVAQATFGPILGGMVVGSGITTVEAMISLREHILQAIRRYDQLRQPDSGNP